MSRTEAMYHFHGEPDFGMGTDGPITHKHDGLKKHTHPMPQPASSDSFSREAPPGSGWGVEQPIGTALGSAEAGEEFDVLLGRLKEAGYQEVTSDDSVLVKAFTLVHGDRQQAYGHPIDDFTRLADLWSVVLSPVLKDGVRLTAEQTVLCMGLVKINRLINSPDHDDSQVDWAGYAEVYNMIQQVRKEQADKLREKIVETMMAAGQVYGMPFSGDHAMFLDDDGTASDPTMMGRYKLQFDNEPEVEGEAVRDSEVPLGYSESAKLWLCTNPKHLEMFGLDVEHSHPGQQGWYVCKETTNVG